MNWYTRIKRMLLAGIVAAAVFIGTLDGAKNVHAAPPGGPDPVAGDCWRCGK